LQIRDVQNFLSYKSYNGGYKIVIVDDAEKMNVDAQDCLLKDLEEPKEKTLFILISSKPDILLPTIFSRCQTIKFFKPKDLPQNTEKIKKEQKILSELMPVINSGLSEKFKYTKSIDFQTQPLSEILEVLQKYYRDILLADYGNKKVINILNLIENLYNKFLFTNASPKLALEILLMEIPQKI
jgi:replication-associated recombination protein RarA